MSRRTAVIEEFDDDTDLPLPTLGDTGRGHVLEEIDGAGSSAPTQARQPSYQLQSSSLKLSDQTPGNTVTDITPYKTWTCIYPIYIDAKRPYGSGLRRISREKSVWWPLSKDIADAAARLGLGTLHEVNKSHPRDWENPGRVRVLWKKDGGLVNPQIKTKKQLLETIALALQRTHPDNIPRPPYKTEVEVVSEPFQPSTKGKETNNKSKTPSKSTLPASKHKSQLPIPPTPLPPVASRISAYSPALVTGLLIDTVKAGMNAQSSDALASPTAGSGGAMKGKRKVVRVRG